MISRRKKSSQKAALRARNSRKNRFLIIEKKAKQKNTIGK
jgi:hypothetical protein